MSDQESGKSFWTTLPGILTGLAALITAVVGLIPFLKTASNGSHHETKVVAIRQIGQGELMQGKLKPVPSDVEAPDLPHTLDEIGSARAERSIQAGETITWDMVSASDK